MKSKIASILVMLMGVFGCSSDAEVVSQAVGFKLIPPVEARNDFDSNLLTVTVMIDGDIQEVSSNSSNTLWTGSLTLPSDRSVELKVDWEHSGYPIATFQTSIGPVSEMSELSVASADYVTTGDEFDADGDGFSNLEELRSNTNPVDPQNIDVRIPDTLALGIPGINGISGVIWESNPITDWNDQPLSIDNLMIDLGTNIADGNTGFRWQALHSQDKLFIIVFGEPVAFETPFGDSTNPIRDDAINLFIDGDNSKGESYDGENDFHITIPLLKLRRPLEANEIRVPATSAAGDLNLNAEDMIQVESPDGVLFVNTVPREVNDSLAEDSRYSLSLESAGPLESLVFSNGRPMADRQVYEISVRLSELGITIGEPFGLDVQIDVDDDGGNRDARFGWKHPSKTSNGVNVDNTISNPSFMGTAILD